MRPSKSNCWTDLRPEADSRSRGSFAGVQCAAGPTVVDSNERGFAECKVQSLSILLSLLFNGIGILSILFILLLTGTNLANGAGLTIVTHGFAVVVESKRPAWVSAMANDIAAVANKNGGNAAIYEMELARSTDFPFPVRVISFSLKSGQPPQQNPNSEVIIELYWNRLADNILVIGANSTGIATAVIPFLANATTVPDLPKPLAQLPIHLIGHSRGGSVVSEISRLLGEKGIWVDQVTTLDPHPVCFGETDADVGTYESVLYADNYYQRISGSPFCGAPSPNGVNVGGARERQLINLNGGYEGFTSDHSDVHLWYHGTVDTSQNASNGEKTIYDTMRDSWYLFSENGGKRAGFYYSRLGGGTVSSLGSGYYNNGDFNNSPANRFSLNRQIDEWPSLITLTHNSTSSVKAGNSFPTRCVIQSYDSGCSVEFYLDTDQNPYNNGEILLPISQAINPQPLTQRGTRTIDANVTVPAGTAPRSYYVYGKIVNPNGTRYRYSVTQVRVDSAAPSPFIITATTQTPNGAPTITIRTVTKSDPGVTYTIYRDGTTFNFSGTEFNNTTITPGATYHYFVRATDSAGLYTDSNTITVIAPNPGVPPNTTAPAAPEGLTVNPAPWSKLNLFSVSWANPTHPRNIVKVWYWIGNTPPGAGQGISRSLPQGNPLQVALPMQQGSSTLYVWLQDDQGNVSPVNYNSAALNLDPNAPIISPTIIPVSTSVSSAISINGTSSDDYSGIAGVTWVNDLGGNGIASVVKSVNGLSATWSVPSVQLASGVNRIKFTVTDNAGNAGHSTVTVNYFDTSNSGSLGVGIQPQGAVDAGAQWRLAGETVWRAPNIAASGIPAGNQTVEFKAVDGWITPLPASVSVVANLTVFLPVGSGTYGSGTVNQAPDVPSNPYPADGDVNISRSGLTLRWSGGHPTGSPDFAVAFDTVNPPGFIAGYGSVPGRTYSLAAREPLLPATTYYWRVQGKVGEQRTDGPVWRFTTDYSYADLIPYEIAVDGNIQPGANVTVRVKVKNQGTFTSAVGCWLNLYLSQTPQGRERRISQFNTLVVPALAPGAEIELQQSVTLANLPAGQSFIDAWVDSAPYGINEQDYENNVRSLAIQYVDGQSPVVTSAKLLIPFAKTGQSNSIVYSATDDVGIKTMDFYYSVNGGVNWIAIQEGYVPPANVANGVFLPWTIPTSLPLDTNLLVRVVARDASGNWGETNTIPYQIFNGIVPTVAVLSPNGGEVLDMNSTQTIRWSVSSANAITETTMWLYNGSGNALHIASIGTNSTGQYSWTLPNNFVAPQGRIRIYVRDSAGNESEDYSDGTFAIRDTSAPPPEPWSVPQIVGSGQSPKIATDKNGNVHLVYLNRSDTGTDPLMITQSISYQKKVGMAWSAPSTVYSVVQQFPRNGAPGFFIRGLQIAVDTNATPHVVWRQEYQRPNSDFSWANLYTDYNLNDIYATSLEGVQWTAPLNVSENLPDVIGRSTLSGYPNLKADHSNRVHIVWGDGVTYSADRSSVGTQNVYHRTRSNGAWSSASQVTTNGGASPSLEVDFENQLHLMYSKGYPQVGYYTKWNGASWSPAVMSFTNSNSGSIRFGIGTSNQPSMVWYDYNEVLQNQKIYFSCIDGAQWAPKEVVSGSLTGARNEFINIDSHGRPHVVFAEVHSANSRLYQQLYYTHKAQTAWTTPYILHFQSQNVDEYSIDSAISSNDELHVVWTVAYGTGIYYNHANVGSTNDVFSPAVSVNPPYSGQVLTAGSAFNIHWQATDDTGVTAVHLHYATNGGSSWTLIATNQANSAVFTWTVPALGTNVGQIRVTARDAVGNTGFGFSGNFTTVDVTPPIISISAPVPPATLTGGSVTNVVWTAADNVGVVRIDLDYSLDNGATWLGLATNLANIGTYPWTVPAVPTSTLLLRASAQDAAGFSAAFTSQPLTIVRGNTPPLAPHSPSPLDGSAFILTQRPGFHWSSSDPDGDALTYQVRFGTNASPPLVLTTSTLFLNPPALRPQRTYYWQVIASDGKATTPGPLWSFTTEAGVLPPTSLAEFKRQTNGYFEFRFDGLFGENQLVQASTNLLDWVTVATFASSNAASVFLDSTATNLHRRFYRVITP